MDIGFPMCWNGESAQENAALFGPRRGQRTTSNTSLGLLTKDQCPELDINRLTFFVGSSKIHSKSFAAPCNSFDVSVQLVAGLPTLHLPMRGHHSSTLGPQCRSVVPRPLPIYLRDSSNCGGNSGTSTESPHP
ncbi:jg27677 [Pararge aegeria aegeria]|uniref:Jg27677 protein n=1 Tax=Pararge aegeria aegeria TaxID=348720 RepID=A0A8S4SR24_9NEOP|nr:jg27677 [Pararge aegeria aegeria]